MNTTIALIVGALVPLLVGGIYSGVKKYLKDRVHFSCPQDAGIKKMAETNGKLVVTVDALLAIQGPQTDALIALLEASKGQVNGNVESALNKARTAREDFEVFKSGQLKIGA